MRRDVRNDDAFSGEGGGSTGPHPHADFHSIDCRIVKIRQARRNTVSEMFAVTVKQQDTAIRRRIEVLHAVHKGFKRGGKRLVLRDQFQHLAAKVFIPLDALSFGDVGTHSDVLLRLAVLPHERGDCRVDPVDRAIPGAIADLGAPYAPLGDHLIHGLEKTRWVIAGVHDAVILPNDLLARQAADLDEFVVAVGDVTLDIRHGHDGMLIQHKFLLIEFAQCALRHHDALL